MGVTIHYSGSLRSAKEVDQLVATASSFARDRGWQVESRLDGVVLRPHPRCEQVELLFKGAKLAQSWTKTQFAGADVHVAVIELFRTLKPIFSRLAIKDEAGYWRTGDRAALEKSLGFTEEASSHFVSGQSYVGPYQHESGRIIDILGGDP